MSEQKVCVLILWIAGRLTYVQIITRIKDLCLLQYSTNKYWLSKYDKIFLLGLWSSYCQRIGNTCNYQRLLHKAWIVNKIWILIRKRWKERTKQLSYFHWAILTLTLHTARKLRHVGVLADLHVVNVLSLAQSTFLRLSFVYKSSSA